MAVALIIPARYGSRRFPGKPLALIDGKSLIQYVYELAIRANLVDNVVVATDDSRIHERVISFGGKVVMTSDKNRTGGDRLAEVARGIDSDILINLQGDEIPTNPALIDELIDAFQKEPNLEMATLKKEIGSMAELSNSNLVKVVTDINGFALYFSRSPIPYMRDNESYDKIPPKRYYKHLGIYIYRRNPLIEFSMMPTCLLEDMERLEQLRFLEMGRKIKVYETDHDSYRIDTQGDLDEVKKIIGG